MERYLQDIVRDKRYWSNKRELIKQREKKISDLNEKLEQELQAIHTERREILSQAKEEATRLLNESNAKIERTIREIKEAQADKTKTRLIREELNQFKQQLAIPDKKPITKYKVKPVSLSEQTNLPLQINDTVKLKGQDTVGTIISLDKTKNKAEVAFGVVKTVVSIKRLERAAPQQNKIASFTLIGQSIHDSRHEKMKYFKPEIDIRGLRGEEALYTVSHFIDEAIMVGTSEVRILHGTGTGVLRQLVRDYLKTVDQVADFHDEHVQLGGAGITVVTLK
jgi:DNA mismatch repair protein MutS2